MEMCTNKNLIKEIGASAVFSVARWQTMEPKQRRQLLRRSAEYTVKILGFLIIVALLLCNIGVSFLLVHPSSCDIKILKMNESDFCKNHGTTM